MSREILPLKEGPYWAYFFGNPAFMFEITLDIGRDGDALFHVLIILLYGHMQYPCEEHGCG